MLKDTTLIAIVRDEEHNAAHGISLWLDATLPFVEKAIIADTGSIDNTLEILKSAQSKYPHVSVFQIPFESFTQARNYTLQKVKTTRAFVLDADELLLPEEYQRLQAHITEVPHEGYAFYFKDILPEGYSLNKSSGLQTIRLFNVQDRFFTSTQQNGLWEGITFPRGPLKYTPFIDKEIAIIKHFQPDLTSRQHKETFWYEKEDVYTISPEVHAKTYGWKKNNPFREILDFPEYYLNEEYPTLVGANEGPFCYRNSDAQKHF
ncbi:MAG: glycosyltransferase [Candidatus Woesearchaeota archaeon]